MKILILTSNSTKVRLIIDKIVAYHEDHGVTVVKMLDGSWYYVRESAEFITNQLVDADASSYVVYNSEEHK